jgi:D-amino-acid dehydrogenase
MKNVVVIGGGIIGLSSAWYLQGLGHRVTVLDKAGFTDNCSYGNLGYVCPSHFIPLASPGIVWQGFKWMFNSKSPFYVQPSLNAALIDWGLKFMKSANREHVAASALPLKEIAEFSQREYEQWAVLPGFDLAYERKGMIEVFQTEKMEHHASDTVAAAQKIGLDAALLDLSQLQALEPNSAWNARGAIYFRKDAHLCPDLLMACLKERLRSQGVILVKGEVDGFEKKNGRITKVLVKGNGYEADEVVVATGSWSRSVVAMVDTNIPMMPGRGYSFTLTDSPYKLHRPAILSEGRVAITPMMNGSRMRYGGTMEIVGTDAPPRYQRVESIVRAVKDFLPGFDIGLPSKDKIWYGYRPNSADGLPYIGRIKKYDNLVVATGHGMLGLSLGAGTGKLVSELVGGQQTSIDLRPFSVERFG